jgi:polysaccharide deacetylase
VLFHNNGLHTAEALPAVIADLKEKGFTFVRIDDLIYKDGYYIDADGRQIKQ